MTRIQYVPFVLLCGTALKSNGMFSLVVTEPCKPIAWALLQLVGGIERLEPYGVAVNSVHIFLLKPFLETNIEPGREMRSSRDEGMS